MTGRLIAIAIIWTGATASVAYTTGWLDGAQGCVLWSCRQ